MKSVIVLLFIFSSFICVGQVRKDSIRTRGNDSLHNKKINKEMQDSSFLKFQLFMQNHYYYFNSFGADYLIEPHKPSLKEDLGKKQITEKEMVEENLNKMLAEIRGEVEDKRPWWLKILQDVLGVATKIAVVALAVGQLLK